MKVVRYDQLHPMLLRQLPAGALPSDLDVALAYSGRVFCERTKVWEEDLGPFDITINVDHCTMTVLAEGETYPIDAEIHQILDIYVNDAAGVTAGRDGVRQDITKYSFNPATNVLTFPYEPGESVTDGLVVKAILIPTYQSREIAAWMLNRYADGIVWGAVAFLTGSKSNAAMFDADTFRRSTNEFNKAIAAAVRNNAGGYQVGSVGIRQKWSFVEK